jgi:hypothetical protein
MIERDSREHLEKGLEKRLSLLDLKTDPELISNSAHKPEWCQAIGSP